MNRLAAAGAYVPRYRITAEEIGEAWDGFRARGVREKRVPAGDEDAVTMAVEAARDALADAPVERGDVGALALGTTTPPLDEGDVGVQVAEILGLRRDVEVTVHAQSTRAGTRALLDALRADGPALAVAADCPVGAPDDALGHAAGAGAVALLAAPEGPVAVADVATYAREFPGTRFRRRGGEHVESYDATAYERTAFREAVAGAVGGLDDPPAAVAPTAPDGSLPGRAARALDGDVDVYHRADDLGDTGAAGPLFGLLAAWDDGREAVTVVGFGDGAGADALALTGSLDAEATRAAEDVSYAEALRKQGAVQTQGGER